MGRDKFEMTIDSDVEGHKIAHRNSILRAMRCLFHASKILCNLLALFPPREGTMTTFSRNAVVVLAFGRPQRDNRPAVLRRKPVKIMDYIMNGQISTEILYCTNGMQVHSASGSPLTLRTLGWASYIVLV